MNGGGSGRSRSVRFSPARYRAHYGPVQGGSRGRWASASSVRRPGFEPRIHDWASSVVPGTPKTRQNPPDGICVGVRYASIPLSSSSSSYFSSSSLSSSFFPFFHSFPYFNFSFFLVAKPRRMRLVSSMIYTCVSCDGILLKIGIFFSHHVLWELSIFFGGKYLSTLPLSL